jgi:uncharacterized membrane-anchored protein
MTQAAQKWLVLAVALGALLFTGFVRVANYHECRAEGHTFRYCVFR